MGKRRNSEIELDLTNIIGGQQCPTEDVLDRYASEELDESEDGMISVHLARCINCRDYIESKEIGGDIQFVLD